jgi:hypothetical protein
LNSPALIEEVKSDHDPLLSKALTGITFETVQLQHSSIDDHFILHP